MAKAAIKKRAKKAAARKKPIKKSKANRKPAPKGPLYLTEADVQRLVTVKDAIATLELMFETWRDPATINLPRQRAQIGKGSFNLMGAALGASEIFGLKAYLGAPGGRFHVLLYSSRDGSLKAMIEADHLGRMRTGAASGLATKILANQDARTLGVIGGGRQALTQVAAVCAVRKIDSVRVFTRTAEHRNAFAKEIERKLRVAAEPVATGEAAIGDADVAITITKSAEPVLRANWLKSGVHVNAAGANSASRREIDAETVLRATVRATDQVAQARVEAGEYCDLVAAGRLQWSDIVELGDILTEKVPGRRGPHDITLYKSLGIALEDIAFADLIWRRAVERGVGKAMPYGAGTRGKQE
ncbi:MAG TPA: ornithine cyclodeaminase family protein [Xanthobacteraceae bacterium]|nr:ornithine cyclodeaminase family protein [Xanthobacteraceae bacterium]